MPINEEATQVKKARALGEEGWLSSAELRSPKKEEERPKERIEEFQKFQKDVVKHLGHLTEDARMEVIKAIDAAVYADEVSPEKVQCGCTRFPADLATIFTMAHLDDETEIKHYRDSLECICDLMAEYSKFGQKQRASDADVDQVYNKFMNIVPAMVYHEASRIKELAEWNLDSGRPSVQAVQHIKDPDLKNMTKLVDIADNDVKYRTAQKPLTRFDKVHAVETLVHMQHKSAPIMTGACIQQAGSNYNRTSDKGDWWALGYNFLDNLTKKILDCHREIPLNTDQVLHRVAGEEER